MQLPMLLPMVPSEPPVLYEEFAMSEHVSDQQLIARTHNTARFFTEARHLSWVLLIATVVWGAYGYLTMPQRKDPEIPVRQALVLCPWPGAPAEKIEALVTQRLEERVAENVKVERVESNTRTGIAAVYITLVDTVTDTGKEFDDIKMKLDTIRDLPQGAGPINFIKDFGDTAALMLTVASPKVGDAEIVLRAQALSRTIAATRAGAASPAAAAAAARAEAPAAAPARATIVHGLPQDVPSEVVQRALRTFANAVEAGGLISDPRVVAGAGFVGLDVATHASDADLLAAADRFVQERLRAAEFHPDAWPAVVIRDPGEAAARLASVAGDRYAYRELETHTELLMRSLKTLPMVSKVTRTGLLQERVYLEYSQERLAAYGVKTGTLDEILGARNITTPGGLIEAGGRNLTVDPSGEFANAGEIGDVLVPTASGRPVYLRDIVAIGRGYESPARLLNFYTARAADGTWRRSRAITLAVQMRSGQKIGEFGEAVDARLAELRHQMPDDLIFARTSDQPRQVEESVHLFMGSLYEAIGLVVLVSLIGFWEWRSALLMALSIPITLAMTFGMMQVLGIDLQQISIASLILALGLLIDDPVVAGDAIKRSLAEGQPPRIAAWLGPTKLANAILFATITNIVAYLPFLLLPGDSGRFLYSLPVVITCSLIASRLASMTFIPLLGYYLLRPKAEPTIEERRQSGFAAFYYRLGQGAIAHRKAVLASSLLVLTLGGFFMSQLKTQYFPQDLQYLSYVDVWLPEDAPLSATAQVVDEVEQTVRRVAGEYAAARTKDRSDAGTTPRPVLKSITTFIGGGGPRFWFSATPEQSQANYAQVLMEAYDKHDTDHLVDALQAELSTTIAGARIDVRRLEVGPPVGIPVSIRVSGEDVATLRAFADRIRGILASVPTATGVRDNWGPDGLAVRLHTDADKANLAGLTNLDVAGSSAVAAGGRTVGVLREGDTQIPVVARLRMAERAQLGDLGSLYVYSSQGTQRAPLQAIASIGYESRTEKLLRRNQFRTITVSAFPKAGVLPSEVLDAALPRIEALRAEMPSGYHLEIGGEREEQVKGFAGLAVVMLISIAGIYLALVFQFRHAIKPVVVFAAIPYGVVGALAALWFTGQPFGFMAFLGVASLIGVIVSHIIVLFDFIEERHEAGATLTEALLDAGIMRLRPVLITVAATVIALFPLAAHGGPLWQPLCYAQIGGLTFATVVTLVLVPVLYATCVLDLKLVRWDAHEPAPIPEPGCAEPATAIESLA
jgi:multidrug efflux pump subunit AcrB